jgi:hypothetical protein
LVLWPVPHCFWGILVLQTNPFAARLFSRLVTQLVPAALVTGIGILLLSNLAKTPDTAPVAAPVDTAITTEAVFKITPREPEEAPAVKNVAPRITAAPKQAAVNTVNTVLPPRKPASERQIASTPAPLADRANSRAATSAGRADGGRQFGDGASCAAPPRPFSGFHNGPPGRWPAGSPRMRRPGRRPRCRHRTTRLRCSLVRFSPGRSRRSGAMPAQ